MTKRNPDELMRKPFAEWCSIAQRGFEQPKPKPKPMPKRK